MLRLFYQCGSAVVVMLLLVKAAVRVGTGRVEQGAEAVTILAKQPLHVVAAISWHTQQGGQQAVKSSATGWPEGRKEFSKVQLRGCLHHVSATRDNRAVVR